MTRKLLRDLPILFSAVTMKMPPSSSRILFMYRAAPEAVTLWPGASEVSGMSLPPFLVQEKLVMAGTASALMVNTLELFSSKLISFIASMNCGLSEN